ncbi:hypothetical protein PTSG_07252 [Salpingoeca rosetta]|uniref:Protein RFT1 homolog n=1 Tax=Salpingoeca rosetta (strain ATCC 50818 / BSB-021) TaxID=946362 RepID=F2UEH7_SALR5|nr:uncharacterized protein PTSG_07252 [Salpingoeca rosetta]EGD75027.1 hypothetical protein PTSG_07252 [Salpingoeca rosetta]|eukprot:XP_004992671.1 hypothetical protein PTSG_07252 [Salpingoeca rosetta]
MLSQRYVQSAAAQTSAAIVLQVLLRIVSFVSNAVIVRVASKEMLGIVNVRLMLLYSTIVFLSREPMRRACLSVSLNQLSRPYWRQLVNLIWIGILSSLGIAGLLSLVWTRLLTQPEMAWYPAGVAAFAASAVIEVMAEPFWIFYQIQLNVRLKIIAEGVSLGFGTVLTMVGLYLRPDLGLLVPSAAHVLTKTLLLAIFVTRARTDAQHRVYKEVTSLRDMLPGPSQAGAWWFKHYPPSMASLALSFFRHGIVKQLLTEGEKYMMTFGNMLSFAQQGVYDVVYSLGSLVPRFLFHPIEENYYTFFAALLTRETSKADKDPYAKKTTADDEALAGTVLQTLLKTAVMVGLVLACFGQGYSRLLLGIYGGENLAQDDGVLLLQAYSVYVLCMALNGISECFVAASSSREEIDEHNRWMVAFSALYIIACFFLTPKLGAVGFIFANCINMLMRASKSFYDIWLYIGHHPGVAAKGNPLTACIPSRAVLFAFALAYVVTTYSERLFLPELQWDLKAIAVHVAVGAASLFLVAVTVYFEEGAFVQDVRLMWSGKPSKQAAGGAATATKTNKTTANKKTD